MKHALTVCILLCIISCSALFSVLYISFNLIEPGNTINQMMRKRVLTSPVLRRMLRLHQVGDARYEFMHDTDLPITIHLYYQEGVSLTDQTKEKILSRMQFITHKYVQGTFAGPTILHDVPEKVNDNDIKRIRQEYTSGFTLFPKTIPLNIFVLKYFSPHPSYAGLVEDDHSIFLFKTAIENVSETTDSIPLMELSTILHEFAHLGGAEHIDVKDCILVDKVENLDFFNKISTIRDSYCVEDLTEIQRALKF